ncbi:hypothetical protein AGOR_G00121820 [Albula goreensis]|uniref:G-protein coupled receptors family 1 profile domain-containing protein n=1 Tax=Albula goreensis TaxID=1534307 RepID=A0A8T3DFK9_9TELE|nr:hypothetical protein AGOR_G00121820 [Albula goreensis]
MSEVKVKVKVKDTGTCSGNRKQTLRGKHLCADTLCLRPDLFVPGASPASGAGPWPGMGGEGSDAPSTTTWQANGSVSSHLQSLSHRESDLVTMNNTTGNGPGPCVEISASFISDILMGIYILAFVLGFIFNLLTLGPIVRQVCNRNVLGVYLLNLSISDLLYIITMPLWIYYYRSDHRWYLGLAACQTAGFFYYSNMYLSIYLLCCISVDRCLTVTFPLKAKSFRRPRYAWGISLLVAAVVMTLHCLVLFMDKLDVPLDKDLRCYESYPLTSSVALFNLIRVGLGFVGPLLVLGFCYAQIFSKVRRSCGVDEQVKRKVKLLSIGVMVIFAICFAPYHVLLLTRSLVFYWMDKDTNCAFEQRLHFYFSCTLALSSLNSVVDPLLYVLVSNGVVEDMRSCCRRGRQSLKPSSATHLSQKRQTCLTNLM